MNTIDPGEAAAGGHPRSPKWPAWVKAFLKSKTCIGLVPQGRVAALPRRLSVNVGGTWRSADAYVNVGGTWKWAWPSVNDGGTWK